MSMLRSLPLVLAAILSLAGCNRRGSLLDQPPAATGDATRPGARPPGSARGSARPPAGTSCMGREDCPSDQVCVDRVCRYRETSVAGEILATAARAQVEAGDWEGAIRTFDQAIEHYDTAHAPVPPDLLCASASLVLRTASDAEGRERGARRADACFRASLPGSPEREEVRRAVARLRFEGLDTALFDRTEPAERFFTQEPSRPTVDALAIDVELPESEDPGVAQVREQLAGEAARRAIAECFVQDWELRHERSASASLIVRYATRLHDMGTYDTYEPTISVEKTTVAEDGFEPCVARSLSGAIAAPRASRVVAWQTSMSITASVQ
ncbi:Hypothetical protein I5071_27410 [Sandaracinus amylolyticus]|nr:Hypothetical protein I5071_27410 [Sandaracinus amylolyticus]